LESDLGAWELGWRVAVFRQLRDQQFGAETLAEQPLDAQAFNKPCGDSAVDKD